MAPYMIATALGMIWILGFASWAEKSDVEDAD